MLILENSTEIILLLFTLNLVKTLNNNALLFTSRKYIIHCLTTIKTETMNDQHADTILGNRASYAHALSWKGSWTYK